MLHSSLCVQRSFSSPVYVRGVAVKQGLEALKHCEGESHTKGLDNLSRNCQEYVRYPIIVILTQGY